MGDIMQHDGQIEAAYNPTTKTYDYDDGWKYIKPIVEEYDIRIANLEVTHPGKPYKGYPQFAAPDELPEAAVNAGFNVILTANNHSCDGRAKGVIRTLDVLDELGVKHTGTFRSQAERDTNYPLMIEQNGMKVALLNYTYGTNGLKVAKPLIVNYIDSVIIKKDIARAKELNADYIICNMHWGTEYKPLPNRYQKTYEQVCYRAGADMVIGGHPHVVQPIEKKKIKGEDKLTVWSLGNFVSNMQIRYTRGGVMVGAKIKKKGNKVKLDDIDYHLVYVLKRKEGKVKQYYILPEFNYNAYRNGFISPAETKKMNEFFADSRKLYGKENKGIVKESLVKDNPMIAERFKHHLSWHYSIWAPENGLSMMKNDILGHYFHRSVDIKGKHHILSGYYNDAKIAKGQMNFLRDCGVVHPKLVKVTPEGITPIE
ncbi:MAG: CapA family protein [Crocinitomicaceae bacterium]|nr:CapA family protein [Crocinitomicaceae bacterium]